MRVRRIAVALVCVLGLGFGLLALGQSTGTPELPDLQAPDFAKATSCPVVRVVDGDTIVVGQASDGQVKVRLIGVDTPETVHPSKPVQEYGKEASNFTKNLLNGENVYLLYEGEKSAFDKYGRTLAYVYRAPDGLFVNAELIRQGYAHAYVVYPFKHLEQFRQLEQFAREAGKGLWGTGAESPTTKPATTAPPVPVVPVVAPPAKTDAGDVIVYVTRTGTKYHRASCRYLAKSSIPMPLKEAKQRYTPCSVCNPPQ